MLYATIGQWRVFLFMALAGAGAGCWYGLILRAGRLMVPGPWLHALLDLFSALGIWIILTWALLAANYGQPRAYALAAAALGFAAQTSPWRPWSAGSFACWAGFWSGGWQSFPGPSG